MSHFLYEISDQLNLRWAWEKVRREATRGDIWFDEIELAGFELELERHLRSIADEFRTGRYRVHPLRPLPVPKQNDKEGKAQIRQAFQVVIRDQVAWTAVVNVVGPHVDSRMPAWSYGNRLFRSIWIEEDEQGRKCRRIGRYRHASGRLYLPFQQSWPVFRRHVYLATRAMMSCKSSEEMEMDDRTEEELALQQRLNDKQRCQYVIPDYWRRIHPRKQPSELYWCSIDLEKFYPSLSLDVVRQNIVMQLPGDWQEAASQILGSMLAFRLNLREWTADELVRMTLVPGSKLFSHIPTGLYVAGFLANAGLLNVDLEVARRLAKPSVAHFRFVDDHVFLAYTMDDLVCWISEYAEILSKSETGVRINLDKVEPAEIKPFIPKRDSLVTETPVADVCKAAEKACRLDPQFPSPLMTKTLALVSGIARMDFNLLETDELAALTDQLEHLLLVDLREDEMPEKTRLSFAATRLARVAECRLANDERIAAVASRQESLRAQLAEEKIGDIERREVEQALADADKEMQSEDDRLKRVVGRAFQLLRKVLREKPDRIRLWTRAVLMCRQTGVMGLGHILEDIQRESRSNALAAEYLRANLLVLLGSQAVVAARILRDKEVARWRKQAVRSFLDDIRRHRMMAPDNRKARRFLRMSWAQYCFGLHCAELVLREKTSADDEPSVPAFLESVIAIGRRYGSEGGLGHGPALWAWWAARRTLRDLTPRADGLVKALGTEMEPSREVAAFWRFFPMDVPISILRQLAKGGLGKAEPATSVGWWFDALRERPAAIGYSNDKIPRNVAARAYRAVILTRKGTVSLYDWSKRLRQMNKEGGSDPRGSEWTALEIVRQVGVLLSREPMLDARYVRAQHQSEYRLPCVHPANFRIPEDWLKGEEPTWGDWQRQVQHMGRGRGVSCVPMSVRMVDRRYTPLEADSPLFLSVNPVRGLGLLLYGLLQRSFDLPAIWNGPGHADALRMLPRILLTDLTCSSWTLGILQGCLQPRATENLFLLSVSPVCGSFDDDTLHDPMRLRSPSEVVSAIEKCQVVLKAHQLSTLNHRARQLTPIDVGQLTDPEWSRAVRDVSTEEDGRE